jgi:hypothetical protein
VAKREGSELFLACNDDDIIDYGKPTNPQWEQGREGRIKITLGTCLQDVEFESQRARAWARSVWTGSSAALPPVLRAPPWAALAGFANVNASEQPLLTTPQHG